MAASKNQRPGTLTSGWKTTVRVALATGATVATLIGTRVLALADRASNAATNPQAASDTANSTANTDINDGPVIVPADSTSQESAQNSTYSTGQRQRYSYVNPAPNQPMPSTRSSRRG